MRRFRHGGNGGVRRRPNSRCTDQMACYWRVVQSDRLGGRLGAVGLWLGEPSLTRIEVVKEGDMARVLLKADQSDTFDGTNLCH